MKLGNSLLSPPPAGTSMLMSGNEAVARAVWDSGVRVAAAYPGTPSTEMLEIIAFYPDIYSEWSVNEKVSLEVALGASMTGARAFCAMKHVGMNVASDALMTMTLTGVVGGLVIAIADDVGFSSSQNEQDSRFWGRFAHLPIFEPSDSQEAYEMTKAAYALSERFSTPVILRMTARVCHVKCVVEIGEREVKRVAEGFTKDPGRWVMVPGNAKRHMPKLITRDRELRQAAETSTLNRIENGTDNRVGFVTSGPAYMHVRETYPDATILKLGFSCPVPLDKVKAFAAQVNTLVVVEETEPLMENEIRAAGISVRGKDLLPANGELSSDVLRASLASLLPEFVESKGGTAQTLFPRPPTMCAACPHLGVYYTLSQMRNVNIAGDIGCYTLGAGQPWNALDTCISMGASMGVALGMDKARGADDEKKKIVAVIGDSTFMHMGMQGLLDITYNRGNVTVLLLDNRAVGMTGGQNNPGNGRDINNDAAPRVDFAKLVEALGVDHERIHVVNSYELPVLFKTLREETKKPGVSVIITNKPCVLVGDYVKQAPYTVDTTLCTGCGNCVDVGCPAIRVIRREKVIKPSGKEVELAFVDIETVACTGCNLCVQTCAPNAIQHATAAACCAPVTVS